jgi:hypothetical protein
MRQLGFSFEPGVAFEITALGAYNYVGTVEIGDPPEIIEVDGMGSEIEVGLYEQDKLVTSVTVMPDDPLIGDFRYAAINPVSVNPGTTYHVIAAFAEEDYFSYIHEPVNVYHEHVTYIALQSDHGTELPPAPPSNPEQWSDEYGSASFLLCE